MGVGCGSPHWGEVWALGREHCPGAPSPENVLVFDLKMVNFDVF